MNMKIRQLVFGVMLLAAAGLAQAATIVVTTATDTMNSDGLCSLREAMINAENADQSGSTDCPAGSVASNMITFAAALHGSTIELAGEALPTITRPLEIVGPERGNPAALTIDAGAASRIFRIVQADVLLTDLNLINGRTFSHFYPGSTVRIDVAEVRMERVWIQNSIAQGVDHDGGAIAVLNSSLVLEESILQFNQAGGAGGAIFASNSMVQLDDTTLNMNVAVGHGGALHAVGGQVTINDSWITQHSNSGDSAFGGALFLDGADLVMSNTNLVSNMTTGENAHGGALYLRNASLSVSGGIIQNNTVQGAGANGGGISTFNANATLSGGCQILNNTTQEDNGVGGAMRIGNGNLDMTNCLVSGNQTFGDNAHGGGIYVIGGNAVIENSQILGNQTHGASAQGGGLRVRDGGLTMTDTLVQDNATSGSGAHGGGIYHRNGETRLAQIRVSGNQTSGGNGQGAGIYLWESELNLRDAWIDNNQADNGAVGAGLALFDGDYMIERSTISGNTGTASGGGMVVADSQLLIVNSTISGNQLAAGTGSGLWGNRSDIELRHVTVADNVNSPGNLSHLFVVGEDEDRASLSLYNTLIFNNRCGGNEFADLSGDGNIGTHASCPGQTAPAAAIAIAALADNGGYAPTHALNTGSLAVNAAGNCLTAYGIDEDQREFARPGGSSSQCDIGAFETDQPPAPVDIGAELLINPAAAQVGQQLSVFVDISNHSPTWASGVGADVDIGNALIIQDVDYDKGTFNPANGDWNIGLLGPGETASMELTVELTASGSREVVISAFGAQLDPVPGNNQVSQVVVQLEPSATLVVTTLRDLPANDGLCSLREAMINANNANQSGSVNCVAGGIDSNTIVFHSDLIGGTIERAANQFPEITRTLQVIGPVSGDPAGLTIDGQMVSQRIFRVSQGSEVLISGLTLTNGQTSGEENPGGSLLIEDGAEVHLHHVRIQSSSALGADNRGGAIAVFDASLLIEDGLLDLNQSEGSGGAIFASNSIVQLDNTELNSNASFGRGGGMHVVGGQLTINNSQLLDHATSDASAFGGALFVDGADLFLNNSTVAGNATQGQGAHGGGVYLRQGNLTMDGGVIMGNSVHGLSANGGGLSVFEGNVSLGGDCEVRDNVTSQSNGFGGAIRLSFGDLEIDDCAITNNRTEGENAHGGGIYVIDGNALIENARIADNRTEGFGAQGGGLRVRDGDLVLRDSVVENNDTQGEDAPGGGIYFRGGQATLEESLIQDNTTAGSGAHGGGLFALEAQLTITDSEVRENQTGTEAEGGGLALFGGGSSYLVASSTIVDNEAGRHGGGAFIADSSLDLVNSTVSANRAGAAGTGAGLYGLHSALDLLHVSVVDNENLGAAVSHLYLFGSNDNPASLNLRNSLVVNNRCGANDFGSINASNSLGTHDSCTGTATPAADINLGPLSDNGGPTPTHALQPPSVAINAAGNCLADWNIDTDQRGQPRPGGSTSDCDVGSFEYQGALPEADLGVAMTASREFARVGQQVNFSIQVSQSGPDAASGVTTQVDWPSGFSFASTFPAGADFDSATGLWTIGALDVGQTASLTVRLIASELGQQTVTATVSALEEDPDESNNVASVSVDVVPESEPMIVTTLADAVVDDGECSLREAIINANNNDQSGSVDCPPGSPFFDEIYFDPALAGGTLLLDRQPLPTITERVTIYGPVPDQADGLIIDGDYQSRLMHWSDAPLIVIRGMTLTGGLAPQGAGGGAVLIENVGNADFRHVRFINNQAPGLDGDGGAVKAIDSSVSFLDCELSGNSSGQGKGGAIFVSQENAGQLQGGSLSLERCLLADNHAGDYGGAIYAEDTFVGLEHSTLSGNGSGKAAGGLYVDGGMFFLYYATLVDNHAETGPQDLVWLASQQRDRRGESSLVASLIIQSAPGTTSCGFDSEAEIDVSFTLATDAACQAELIDASAAALGPLADNGGPTRTHALEAGSAAIDLALDCGTVIAGDNGGGLIDQRGQPRPGAGSTACDAGAYERQEQTPDRIFHDRFSN